VRAAGNGAVFRAGAPNHPASIVMLDLTSGAHRTLKKETDLLDQSELCIDNYLSTAKSIEFSTTNGNSYYQNADSNDGSHDGYLGGADQITEFVIDDAVEANIVAQLRFGRQLA
jgi:hypothetical protein